MLIMQLMIKYIPKTKMTNIFYETQQNAILGNNYVPLWNASSHCIVVLNSVSKLYIVFFLQITHLTLFFDITKFRNMFRSKSSSFRVSGVSFEEEKQCRVYSRCSVPQCNVNFHFTKERNCFREWHSAEFHRKY